MELRHFFKLSAEKEVSNSRNTCGDCSNLILSDWTCKEWTNTTRFVKLHTKACSRWTDSRNTKSSAIGVTEPFRGDKKFNKA